LVVLSLRVPRFSQAPAERFWIGGRYDGNRIIVYFDAVKLAGTLPGSAIKIAYPVATGFFSPVALPQDYIDRFQRSPGAERFKSGDRYDLLMNDGAIAPFTLTTLVGFENDEFVGNDSYIGALGTLDRFSLIWEGNYFVVRRHEEIPKFDPAAPLPPTASLLKTTVPFNVQNQIVTMLTDRMKADSRINPTGIAEKISPAFVIQAFTVADGSLRYHVQAEWRAGRESGYDLRHTFAAWLAGGQALRILATEQLSFGSDAVSEQKVLSVVSLGRGRTGLVVSIRRYESLALQLVEYRDGARLSDMRVLQNVSTAE
jgi:hypothetical protein